MWPDFLRLSAPSMWVTEELNSQKTDPFIASTNSRWKTNLMTESHPIFIDYTSSRKITQRSVFRPIISPLRSRRKTVRQQTQETGGHETKREHSDKSKPASPLPIVPAWMCFLSVLAARGRGPDQSMTTCQAGVISRPLPWPGVWQQRVSHQPDEQLHFAVPCFFMFFFRLKPMIQTQEVTEALQRIYFSASLKGQIEKKTCIYVLAVSCMGLELPVRMLKDTLMGLLSMQWVLLYFYTACLIRSQFLSVNNQKQCCKKNWWGS